MVVALVFDRHELATAVHSGWVGPGSGIFLVLWITKITRTMTFLEATDRFAAETTNAGNCGLRLAESGVGDRQRQEGEGEKDAERHIGKVHNEERGKSKVG